MRLCRRCARRILLHFRVDCQGAGECHSGFDGVISAIWLRLVNDVAESAMAESSVSQAEAFRAAEHAGWQSKVAAYDQYWSPLSLEIGERLLDAAGVARGKRASSTWPVGRDA